MIPQTIDDVGALASEAERQLDEIEKLMGTISEDAALWRPGPGRWSVTDHLAHLCIINDAYLASIEAAIAGARERGGPRSEGPYRHPIVGVWFARSMEPPPKRRLKTFKSMVPDPGTDSDAALTNFKGLQERLVARIEEARGLDLGKIRFGSPFLALMRLSLGTCLEALLAHNRRHIWLMRETLTAAGSPIEGGTPDAGS